MTIDNAIKTLEVAKAECEWNAPLEYQGAFDTAIKALKNSVPYEVYERAVIERDMQWNSELGEEIRKDLQPTCNQLATDCISRQAAIDAVLGAIYDDEYWKEQVERAINTLPSVQPEQQWIPCSERLPEEHIGFYLVTVQKRRITELNVVGCDNTDTVYNIDIARWDYDRRAPQRGYHWCKADKVIAWMPLPEPYREGKKNDN